jgi:hypothetical protein
MAALAKAQIKSAVGYQSNSAFVWALSASLSPRSPPAKFVVHQNCMKIKRAPLQLQLAITLVVHCGTDLGRILRSPSGEPHPPERPHFTQLRPGSGPHNYIG